MNLFWREMKAHRKSLIIWCIGMILLIASGMGKYAGFSSSGQSMDELMGAMPESLKTITGMGSFDLSLATGFYGVLFLYMVLLATVHAVLLGATIISKEERDKTAEFLFVKPVSRTKVIVTKMLAALTNVLVLTVVSAVTSLFMVGYYSDGEPYIENVLVTIIGMLILQVLFLGIGTMVGASYKKSGKAATLSSAILLLAFLLSVAVDLSDALDGVKYVTPFKYFEADQVMYGGGLDPVLVGVSVVLVAILSALTLLFYRRRDLHV
ncbi:ABC transporter permease subunit [Halobacillus mangrovi]|uniref:ABC transporter permease subunit n=1 Tax=Halobacillus mangrovi TaxID=402384 RepID=UPI003D98C5D8